MTDQASAPSTASATSPSGRPGRAAGADACSGHTPQPTTRPANPSATHSHCANCTAGSAESSTTGAVSPVATSSRRRSTRAGAGPPGGRPGTSAVLTRPGIRSIAALTVVTGRLRSPS
ncbi:hypothetical protein BJF78_24065 [Pseudonocardia sp. CNS-139]|nr:hypothetical protein BJF78_24065 [Pseudonocardia sp. CNS-139]